MTKYLSKNTNGSRGDYLLDQITFHLLYSKGDHKKKFKKSKKSWDLQFKQGKVPLLDYKKSLKFDGFVSLTMNYIRTYSNV